MIDRRKFMKYLGILAGILTTFPSRLARAKALALPLEKTKQLQSVGGSVILKLKGKEVLFIRDTETTVRALDPTCTHKGCKVAFIAGENRIVCPCHQSAFDPEGKLLKGPASKDLKNYGAKLEENQIIFSMD
ncbi:MAG: Rieske (2Fe-2S) protein [Desulfobacterales bacterium]|nr:MAG: Rieske (2Fe-2S) protein [Desulfobacterales bacterium]